VETGRSLAESSKEGHGSNIAALLLMLLSMLFSFLHADEADFLA
jgi:hypothetical protein